MAINISNAPGRLQRLHEAINCAFLVEYYRDDDDVVKHRAAIGDATARTQIGEYCMFHAAVRLMC